MNRRELLQGGVAAAALATNAIRPAVAASEGKFSIDAAFAEFMREIGGLPVMPAAKSPLLARIRYCAATL